MSSQQGQIDDLKRQLADRDASLASRSASWRLRSSIWPCWLDICSRSSRNSRSIGDSVGAFFLTGFLAVVRAGVDAVCACIVTVLTISIAASAAFSCFVMDPRNVLGDISGTG